MKSRIIFKLNSRRELASLNQEFAFDIDKKVFNKMYRNAVKPTGNVRNFMMIDAKTIVPKLKYRRNYDGILRYEQDDIDESVDSSDDETGVE